MAVEQAASPDDSPPWRTTLWLTLLSVAGLLAYRIPHLRDALSPDEALYILQAEVIKRGGLPYRDLWDGHAPGLFFLVALLPAALLKAGAAIRLISVIALGAGALLGVRLMQQARLGMPAMFTGVMVYTAVNCLDSFEADFFETEQILVALLLAMVYALQVKRRPVTAWLLWGIAALFKQTAVLFLPLLLLMDLGDAQRRAGLSWKNCATRVLAAAAPWLVVLLYFAARGGLRELFQAVIFDALGYRAIHAGARAWYRSGQFFCVRLWADLLIPALILIFALRKTGRPLARLCAAGGLLLLTALLYLRFQGLSFPHHAIMVTPALLLLSGAAMQGYWALMAGAPALRLKIFLAVWPLGFFWASLQPVLLVRENQYPNRVWNFHSFDVRDVARAIHRDIPDARIFSLDMHPGWYRYGGAPPPREVWVPFRLGSYRGGTYQSRRGEVERALADYGAGRRLLLIYYRPPWMEANPALDDYQAALRARGAKPFPLAEKLHGIKVPPEISADELDLRADQGTPQGAPQPGAGR